MIIDNVIVIVRVVGVSELVIGLIVIVIGISLFELVMFIVGVLKGEDDMVVGNIIGLNIFNIVIVLGVFVLLFSGDINFEVF